MNYVTLERGQVLYAPAGMLHACLQGLGVEVMATSDNVLRGGLTAEHIDTDELLRVVDTTPGSAPTVTPTTIATGVEMYSLGLPDFQMLRIAPLWKAGDRFVDRTDDRGRNRTRPDAYPRG